LAKDVKEKILAEAQRVGLGDRLLMPALWPNPARYIACSTILPVIPNSETIPIR